MNHYICTGGCGAAAEIPGECQAINCPKHGQPFEACDCPDNKHYGKVNQQPEMTKEDMSGEHKEKKWWQVWK